MEYCIEFIGLLKWLQALGYKSCECVCSSARLRDFAASLFGVQGWSRCAESLTFLRGGALLAAGQF